MAGRIPGGPGGGRRGGFERPKNARRTFMRVLGYMLRQKWLMLCVLLCIAVSAGAGVFTTNRFCAAPVTVSRENLGPEGCGLVRGVVINSGNANAATGEMGISVARETCEVASQVLACEPNQVLVASTGVIGVPLAIDLFETGIPEACDVLSRAGGADAARAIMTTDTHPKEYAVSYETETLEYVGSTFTVGGMCKGAGMIAPKMVIAPHATMLCFITTDAEIGNELLSELLAKSVEASFNHITVDNDMSTNDTVVLMANGASGAKIEKGTEAAEHFAVALGMVTEHLARSIVFDGEGVTKFVTVEVTGAANEKDAELAARAIANSPLCKTAWFGCDPNWGRILAAAGYSGAVFAQENVSLDFDELPVVRGGLDAGTPENELAELMKRREFTVKIDLGEGSASATVWTGDFTYEYVKINADYHT